MRKKNDKLFSSEIQKILSKLISEEQIAHDFYIGCIVATSQDEAQCFMKMFIEIAKDEMDDHCRKLVDWAVSNDYDVPFKYKDFEKSADGKIFRSFNSLKTGEKAKFYIDKAIEQEELAIKSYEEEIKTMSESDAFDYSLYEILMQNYLDEKEHLAKLQLLKEAMKNDVNLIGF